MKESTKCFIEIAKKAMQAAYYNEVCNCEMNNPNIDCNWDGETSKKIGDVLQQVSNLL
jgi:hypothetical protein